MIKELGISKLTLKFNWELGKQATVWKFSAEKSQEQKAMETG